MKKIIYTPTKVEDELPEELYVTEYDIYSIGHTICRVKPTEAHVFTDEQLLELKKKIANEIWDILTKPIEFTQLPDGTFKSDDWADKQSFLNSIEL